MACTALQELLPPSKPCKDESNANSHKQPQPQGQQHTPVRAMLLCGSDVLESFVKPGVWVPEQVEEILVKHGVVAIARSAPLTTLFHARFAVRACLTGHALQHTCQSYTC